MKAPTLGSVVMFAVLTNEPAQSFVAATGGPVGDAVIQPTPYPGGFRAATVVGVLGKPDSGRASLLVYKQPGDPYAGDGDQLMQRLGDVPYSAHGIPGTWMHEQDAAALQHRAPVAAPVNAGVSLVYAETLPKMSKDDLFAHAKKHFIDLGGATTLRDALPIVAKFHDVTLPA